AASRTTTSFWPPRSTSWNRNQREELLPCGLPHSLGEVARRAGGVRAGAGEESRLPLAGSRWHRGLDVDQPVTREASAKAADYVQLQPPGHAGRQSGHHDGVVAPPVAEL